MLHRKRFLNVDTTIKEKNICERFKNVFQTFF